MEPKNRHNNKMLLKSGLTVNDNVNITEEVFHIETQDEECILCNIEDAYKIIKSKECYYLSHFRLAQMLNVSESYVIDKFENK